MLSIYSSRLATLQNYMRERNWDYVIISGSDPHLSEYIAPRWKVIEWLTGFDGEGDMVVGRQCAGIWTDSRYSVVANRISKDVGIDVYLTRRPDSKTINDWIIEDIKCIEKSDVVIVFDGSCYNANEIVNLKSALNEVQDDLETDIKLLNKVDFIDYFWENRPSIPTSPVITLSNDIVGKSRQEKIEWLRSYLRDNLLNSIFISSLDEIAWLLNIRGDDIDYNPVVLSYLYVSDEEVKWFVRKDGTMKFQETIESFAELKQEGIQILNYSDVNFVLSNLLLEDYQRLQVDVNTLNYSLYELFVEVDKSKYRFNPSPIQLQKAIKNVTEISGMRDAHLVDGIAMERFLYWLEKQVNISDGVTEYDASVKLREIRSMADGYVGESFATISAYEENAALPHYVTPQFRSSCLYASGLYLCDSGAQYIYGTTDITRTIPLGRCTTLQKEDYTLVLKGHINLAKTIFPVGTSGCHLDSLARNPLWQYKRNYGHGTGHGVGFFLNVHEGPFRIGQNYLNQPLREGMITSIEPGIYRENNYGIRHENLYLCTRCGDNEFGEWLQFESLTLCHFDTSIILKHLLTDDEVLWLNTYNQMVYDKLEKYLSTDLRQWLYNKTRPI